MATTTIHKGQPGSRAWFRDSFVLHKLHSLSGVFPIGVFLIQHLLANSYSLRSAEAFNTVIAVFGHLPFVAVLEIGLLAIPILFHSIYGFIIAAEMQGPGGNLAHYGYTRNWLYWLQRWSGVIAFFYMAFHVYSTSITRRIVEHQQHSYDAGFWSIGYQAMAWRFAEPWYLLIYVVGITMAVFHFANGMFNFCIRWGITIGERAQRVSAMLWSGLGAALLIIGLWTAINFYQKGQPVRAEHPTLESVVRAELAKVAADKARAEGTPIEAKQEEH